MCCFKNPEREYIGKQVSSCLRCSVRAVQASALSFPDSLPTIVIELLLYPSLGLSLSGCRRERHSHDCFGKSRVCEWGPPLPAHMALAPAQVRPVWLWCNLYFQSQEQKQLVGSKPCPGWTLRVAKGGPRKFPLGIYLSRPRTFPLLG